MCKHAALYCLPNQNLLLCLIYYNPKWCSPGADASFLVPGFFVDINLFKADRERAAEIARNSNDLLKDVNGSNGTIGKDGLADEDANLMIKLKFLTYKVCMPIRGYGNV